MDIFLSYASQHREVADAVAFSLRDRGHQVFLDRDDLPPGRSYDDQIEAAIKRSDLLIFLISPESVTPGKWTLTELKFAREKWRSPGSHVLPVMIAPTDLKAVPAYLKAVTILEPHGNVAAEVSAAVATLRGGRMGWLAAFGAGALAAIAMAVVAYWHLSKPVAAIALEAPSLVRHAPGFFGVSDVYRVPIKIRNTGDKSVEISNVRIETAPPDVLLERPESSEPGKDMLSERSFTLSSVAGAGAGASGFHTMDTFALVSLVQGAGTPQSWRVCATAGERRQCTQMLPWQPTGATLPAKSFEFPDEIAGRIVDVAADVLGFVVATRLPNAVYRLSPAGAVVSKHTLSNEPTVVSFGPAGLFIGLRPNKVIRLDSATFSPVSETEIKPPGTLKGTFGDPISAMPFSIAQSDGAIWVLTRGGASGSGLFYTDRHLSSMKVPPYFDKVAFDLRDIHLISDAQFVWGAQTETTPASLHRFTPEQYVEFKGHDYEALSCASDIGVQSDGLIVPTCQAQLQLIKRPTDSVVILQNLGRLSPFEQTRNTWTTVRLVPTQKKIIAAVNVTVNPAGAPEKRAVLQLLADGREQTLLRVDNAHIVAVAADGATIISVFEMKDGNRQEIALRY